jgi:hypothetical protein
VVWLVLEDGRGSWSKNEVFYMHSLKASIRRPSSVRERRSNSRYVVRGAFRFLRRAAPGFGQNRRQKNEALYVHGL